MALIDLLNENVIKVSLQARTKEEVIRELLTLLSGTDVLLNPEIVIQAVLEREGMGSTGLDKGIAVPHARTVEVGEPCVVLGISQKGIEFNSLDGEDSHLFFMILAPPDQSSQHIQILSEIAGISRNEELRLNLINASSPQDVLDLFKKV